MDNIISYIICFSWLPHLLMGLLGLLLGWLLFRGKVQAGDLSIEGEGQLRADADGLRTRISELEGRIGRRDVTINGLEGQLTAAPVAPVAPAASADGDDDETYALEWRNRYLAARVKYLEGRISDAPAPKKKAVKKKAAPKKRVAKKAAPKKKIIKKKAAPKKAAPKKTVAKKAPAKKKAPAHPNDKYYALVRKQDAKASKAVIDNIVKYCGIALRTRDGSLVACTDEKERDTIAKGFAIKKLGMKTGQAKLVADTCDAMKATRMKNRVAFYYVMAKKAGKLSVFK